MSMGPEYIHNGYLLRREHRNVVVYDPMENHVHTAPTWKKAFQWIVKKTGPGPILKLKEPGWLPPKARKKPS